MKTIFKLYNPTNENIKPIKIKVTKDELQKIVVGLYKKVNIHPIGRKKMKGDN